MKTTRTTKALISLLLAIGIFLVLQGGLIQAKTAGQKAETQRIYPKNPVHHCIMDHYGTEDHTDWHYVYFGSYPQTEVTGKALTTEIIKAAYDENGDAWVNNVKYRRISKSDTNNNQYFGEHKYRYFKWESIKWRVLHNDGSAIFLMADKGIDCKDYHTLGADISWENSTIRQWLNKDFYDTAFSSDEQQAIVKQTIVNEDNSEYETEGGSNTKDKVFLLSMEEVLNPGYGFCEKYDMESLTHMIQVTDYAHAMGAYTNSNRYQGNGWWWLRSSGYTTFHAVYVGCYGLVRPDGDYIDAYDKTCMPALYLDVSSDLWTCKDDGNAMN
ncbi:DUF6273 domain-containing protein [Lachnospiraceae bacterium 66-29]